MPWPTPTGESPIFARGYYDRAIADYDKSIELEPDNAYAYSGRGNAYFANSDYDSAVADYDRAIQLNPDLAEAKSARAAVSTILRSGTGLGGAVALAEPSASATVPPAAADLGRRVALVIGIDAYRDVPKLKKAVGDSRAMAEALQELGFVVTEVIDPDRRAFNQAVATFGASIAAGDTVFVHFSGHGVEIDGENYLLPADVPKPVSRGSDLVKSEAIAMSELVARITDAGSTTQIFVVDSCRDNPFDQIGVRSVGSTRGLVRIEAPVGTFIMYSAGFRQKALDELGPDDVEPTSVYTRVLLKHLNRPEVTLVDIAQDVRSEVEALARGVGHDQRPAYYDELSDRVYLVTGKSSPDAGVPSSGDHSSAPPVILPPNFLDF